MSGIACSEDAVNLFYLIKAKAAVRHQPLFNWQHTADNFFDWQLTLTFIFNLAVPMGSLAD